MDSPCTLRIPLAEIDYRGEIKPFSYYLVDRTTNKKAASSFSTLCLTIGNKKSPNRLKLKKISSPQHLKGESKLI